MTFQYGDSLRKTITGNLDGFSVIPGEGGVERRAAVAVVVVNACDVSPVYGIDRGIPAEAALILTVRAAGLKKHPGQWALPGGVIEEGELPEETALRELEEEVGVRLGNDAVLGRLDDFTTRSGFIITPVVVWGEKNPAFSLNREEVKSVHCIPLREFRRADAPVLQQIPDGRNPVLFMPVGNGWIASPTGAIIYQFSEVALSGACVRVSHFEQPYFAWR